jgi:hypothetical protein
MREKVEEEEEEEERGKTLNVLMPYERVFQMVEFYISPY